MSSLRAPHQATFLKGLRSDHGTSPARTFEAFCEMGYCAMAKASAIMQGRDALADTLEDQYMRRVKAVGDDVTRSFPALHALVVEALTEHPGEDFLGPIAGHEDVRALNGGAGQVFTPYAVASCMARIAVHDAADLLQSQPYITLAEPACGAGAMVLAAVEVLKEQGVNPTTQLWVEATDISALCMWMTYIQLGLVGCSGVARHGDTLRMEMWEAALFPLSMIFHARHGWPFQAAPVAVVPFALEREVATRTAVQSNLFEEPDKDAA